uniref:WGS project CAEQ00000000 data, annotated contig 1010 n=1 Tax=Trypanosoma congolense (strain IL3000) TaxID=1068625 RepID=F9W368_TRYCI|nr:unnamed protein product [Trypanosoma congolense IL3000]
MTTCMNPTKPQCQSNEKGCVAGCLILTSISVRELPNTLCDLPLVACLSIDALTITTDVLKPVPAAGEETLPNQPNNPQHSSSEAMGYASSEAVIELEPLCIVFPLADSGTTTESADGEASAAPNGGLCVGLRAAGGSVMLGTAACTQSGAWFPLRPCGGRVRVTYKHSNRRKRKHEIFRRLQEAQSLYLSGGASTERKVTDGLVGPSLHVVPAISAASASASPMEDDSAHRGGLLDGVFSTGRSQSAMNLPLCQLLSLSEDETRHVVERINMAVSDPNLKIPLKAHSESPNFNGKSCTCGTGLLKRRLRTSKPALVGACFGACGAPSSEGTRGREGQPRSLVFSDIRVRGFTPLSSTGSWQLEFSLPIPHVSVTKYVVKMPSDVDAGDVERSCDSLTIDLPLFLRGEVQIMLCAAWNDSNGGEGQLRFPSQIEFEPIVVHVADSQVQQQERRYYKQMGHNGGDAVLYNLSVQLVATLEFFAPLREGRNGRPTSAYPVGRPSRRQDPCGKEYVCKVCDDNQPLERDSSVDAKSQVYQLPPEAITGMDVSNDKWLMTREAEFLGPQSSTDQAQPSPISGNVVKELMFSGRTLGATEPPTREGVSYSPSLLNTIQQLRPEVFDLVPCFTEERRRAVFQIYDVNKRGYITLEQLVHFCRAHVALFADHQSDLDIMRLLLSYFPLKPQIRMTATEGAAKASSSCLLQARKACLPVLERRLKGRGSHLTGAEAVCVPQSVAASLYSRVKGSSWSRLRLINRCITYDLFEVIALRLASM